MIFNQGMSSKDANQKNKQMDNSIVRNILGSLILLAGALGLAPETASAKDMSSRLGVGYRNTLVTTTLPSTAIVYSPSPEYAVYASLGVDTEDTNSKFAMLVGARRIIFREDNMNFYSAGQMGLVNQEVSSTKDSGFEIAALVGGEFFLPGLDSLGFNFETGLGVTTVKKTRFRTIGDSFVGAGMTFYF